MKKKSQENEYKIKDFFRLSKKLMEVVDGERVLKDATLTAARETVNRFPEEYLENRSGQGKLRTRKGGIVGATINLILENPKITKENAWKRLTECESYDALRVEGSWKITEDWLISWEWEVFGDGDGLLQTDYQTNKTSSPIAESTYKKHYFSLAKKYTKDTGQ